MTVRIAINGFGRIGRCVARAIFENPEKFSELELVAVNDLTPVDTIAHLFKYDSVHGKFADVHVEDGDLVIKGKKVKFLSNRNIEDNPWGDLNIDIVMECTGIFRTEEKASKHLTSGAKKVMLSAPGKGGNIKTYVHGVNCDSMTAADKLISIGSCTTNCLSPVAKTLNDAIGITRGHMTTVHSYTSDQRIVDLPHSDLRRARAAAVSMIPTTTGAAIAVTKVIPELNGKLDGVAIRVPTPNVSLVDFTFVPARDTTVEEINNLLVQASDSSLRGIMGVSNEPLVSIDYMSNQNSSTVDLAQTKVIEGKLVRVMSWYDNEWGFSNRMADMALKFAKL